MAYPLSLIRNPKGNWQFVGRVPIVLGFEYDDVADAQCAAQYGLFIARKIAEKEGRHLETRTWPTQEEALAEADRLGFTVAA